ncbi:MAG: DUF4388 domain-containing protein [Acidobacteria bacterium]|nr:DUF4388 domain-containing protein [Acidobacteriota bacterium]
MSLTGQLSDLHLSELIEFFCNQRKTGRLKVDYALAPGVFFIKEGDLTDAKVGALNGKDAVFYALTLPSANFDFNPGMESSRRTINEPWASVVLEGLRRIDEGAMPEFDVFGGDDELDAATLDYLDCVEESKSAKGDDAKSAAAPVAKSARADAEQSPPAADETPRRDDAPAPTRAEHEESPRGDVDGSPAGDAPLSLTVEAANGGGRRRVMIAGVVAALVLVCAVAAIPLSRHFSRKDATPAPQPAPQAASAPTGAQPAPDADADNNTGAPAEANATDAATAEEAARREQQQRDARERLRKQREEAAKNAQPDATAQTPQTPAQTANAPKPGAPAGPKTVRVQITYDEAGRVTQAAAVGTSPGAEAYAATAVRVARSRHFAPGKAGSTVVTIPIN